MDKQNSEVVIFDYTTFLGADSKKKWTFVEAFSSIAPVFGLAWRNTLEKEMNPQERFIDKANSSLSAQSSDESNIIRLAEIAKLEGIKELKLMMPYELDQNQLDNISQESEAEISRSAQDEFMIRF